MEWYEIASLVIGIAGALLGIAFGAKFKKAVRLVAEIGQALIKSGEVFMLAAEALKDRKVTKAEAVLLLKAWQEAYQEFYDVYLVLVELLPASAIKFLFRR